MAKRHCLGSVQKREAVAGTQGAKFIPVYFKDVRDYNLFAVGRLAGTFILARHAHQEKKIPFHDLLPDGAFSNSIDRPNS